MVSSVNCAVRRGGSPSLALTHLDMSECQGLEDQGLLRLLANCPAISHLYLRKCSGVTGRRNNIPSMTDGSLIDPLDTYISLCRRVSERTQTCRRWREGNLRELPSTPRALPLRLPATHRPRTLATCQAWTVAEVEMFDKIVEILIICHNCKISRDNILGIFQWQSVLRSQTRASTRSDQ